MIRGAGIWLFILAAAIGNGFFRELVLVPVLGAGPALPVSGVLLAVLILLIAWLAIPAMGSAERGLYLRIGALWVLLTLAFEFLFGHFLAGRPWEEILAVFDVSEGDLFLLDLLVAGCAPWLAARGRGLL